MMGGIGEATIMGGMLALAIGLVEVIKMLSKKRAKPEQDDHMTQIASHLKRTSEIQEKLLGEVSDIKVEQGKMGVKLDEVVEATRRRESVA
jgi:hypothetical protein